MQDRGEVETEVATKIMRKVWPALKSLYLSNNTEKYRR